MHSTEWFLCMLPTFLKNYWTELHEIFRDDLSSSKDQSITFWEQSGQSQGHEVKNYWTELQRFSGKICYHPRTNRLDFGSDQVKGQGHEKVKKVFLS